MRLEDMLLGQPGTVVSTDSWTPVDVLTKQMIVDIEHAVNETFDRYEADGRFKGVVVSIGSRRVATLLLTSPAMTSSLLGAAVLSPALHAV